jgi:hypothetical protein
MSRIPRQRAMLSGFCLMRCCTLTVSKTNSSAGVQTQKRQNE